MTAINYFFWGITQQDPDKRKRCDPRLLERLGVRKEVCEQMAREVADQGVGE